MGRWLKQSLLFLIANLTQARLMEIGKAEKESSSTFHDRSTASKGTFLQS